MIKKSVGDVTR